MQSKTNEEKNVTAQPQATPQPMKKMEYTKASVKDAKISGYTDEKGHAVDMAKPDVKGNPTGSLTDIGAGRSSVVKPRTGKTTEDAPVIGEEQAP